jgi:cytochrome c-type biogenesis protein CcmH/NrfF
VAEGKSREQVYEYYIAKFGSQEPLASPIDRGFNRLAWFVPYLVGTSGALGIALVALRWSRRPPASQGKSAAESAPADPDLDARLNDELRDLD